MTFGIGLIAGVTAIFLPRFLAELAIDSQSIDLFKKRDLMLGGGFSIIVGICAPILTYSQKFDPTRIFMSALGVPALISGSYGTAQTGNELAKRASAHEQEQLEQGEVSGQFEVIPSDRLRPSEKNAEKKQPLSSPSSGFLLVSPAYAEDTRGPSSPDAEEPSSPDADESIQSSDLSWLLGTVSVEPKYLIGVGQFSTHDEAIETRKLLDILDYNIRNLTNPKSYVLIDPNSKSLHEIKHEALDLKKKIESVSATRSGSSQLHPIVVPKD